MLEFAQHVGRVISAMNDVVVATLPLARVGCGVFIHPRGAPAVPAVVTRVEEGRVRLAAFAPLSGVAAGDAVESDRAANSLGLGTCLLGRAIDAAGRPIDGHGSARGRRAPVILPPIDAALRSPVAEPFWTGVRAIDGLLTLGRGSRVGIFGGPGTGKSVLVEMLARGARADAVIAGLIGERGREAAKWIERIAPHATLVIVPSDRPAAERVRGAQVAVAQAAELRRRGLNVLVILDSIARFCAAARELAIANGEAPGRGGYPPSVFNEMARLLERGGNVGKGSMTMIVTVLSDGADEREPLSDAARAALDGHVVLSAPLAQAGHYPAVDVLASTSRTMNDVITGEHRGSAQRVRQGLALLAETKDARELGLAQPTPALERAVALQGRLERFLRQPGPAGLPSATLEELDALAAGLRDGAPEAA
jgi:FliI/YscN family ATPase